MRKESFVNVKSYQITKIKRSSVEQYGTFHNLISPVNDFASPYVTPIKCTLRVEPRCRAY